MQYNKVLQVRHILLRKRGRRVPFFSSEKLCSRVRRRAWVKVELSFNLVEGQLYLLTYVNEYRGGPWAKNTH